MGEIGKKMQFYNLLKTKKIVIKRIRTKFERLKNKKG
jgi:hypothetical protein